LLTDTCCLLPTTEEEAYTLVRLFELEKTKTKSLKNQLGLVVGASALVILLLGACTFGAVFVAVKATKDTQVSTSGALMNKEGSRMLSTVAHGTRFQLFNTSEDTPLCVSTIN
jgi:predicted AAA+ superfamily ATPase